MTFTVTYRAKDGVLREERIEAADRAGCVAECRRRGIAPARIKEGGGRDGARPSRERRVRDNAPYHGANGQDARSSSQRAGRPLSQWIVAVLIAAAAAGGVWWWIGRGEARPSQEARHSREARPKAERPNTASVQQQDWMPRGGVEAAPAATTSQQAAMAAKGAPAANDEVVWRQVTTNSDGVVTEKYRTADGKSHRVIRHPRRVFKNASDQLIAMAISASKQGGSMPPLPLTDATEKDFLDSLMQPIVLNDDDPPDVKELKRDVAAVREQLVDMVKGGMTVKQALIEHQKAVNSNADFRGDALEKLAEVQAEGDREMTEEFRKRINEEFEKRGMAPVENRRKKQ